MFQLVPKRKTLKTLCQLKMQKIVCVELCNVQCDAVSVWRGCVSMLCVRV